MSHLLSSSTDHYIVAQSLTQIPQRASGRAGDGEDEEEDDTVPESDGFANLE